MYRIVMTPKARKELKLLSRLHKEAMTEAIEFIREYPFHAGKPLTKELTGTFSHRVGLYRIIYKINKQDKIITILTAGHRRIVYK